MTARDEILRRVRSAVKDVPQDEPPVDANAAGLCDHAWDQSGPHAAGALLSERLMDYRAHVRTVTAEQLPGAIEQTLAGASPVVVPVDVDTGWLTALQPSTVRRDDPPLTPTELDAAAAVITGCAAAIAETGTIVLDAGCGQGRRLLSLLPDTHICVIHIDQVLATVPEALAVVDPRRPLTFISGPSATSDIELSRVEGVHGPRNLHVLIVAEDAGGAKDARKAADDA